MAAPPPEVASWQDVGYRCPRPGFFLGDDGSMASAAVLAPAGELADAGLGRLGRLPLELLHQVVDELAETDVRALVALRNSSRAAAAVVDSFRDFATVAAFPRALGALVRLAEPAGAGPAPASALLAPVSVRALAACLRSTSCASCLRRRQEEKAGTASDDDGDDVPYGDYVYLLAPERVCYACFRSQPEYLPVARFAADSADTDSTARQQHRGPGDRPPPRLTSIRVPPGRYGVLARLTQPVDLFDRRQVQAAEAEAEGDAQTETAPSPSSSSSSSSSSAKHSRPAAKPTRPDPLRYAAVIPGPYWVPDASPRHPGAATALDRGYACRACAQTDRKTAGHAGWADPLTRYTREGLARHVADPRFGGRVLRRRVGGGAVVYEHDAPRRAPFPPPVEFGATADLARRYEAAQLVPAGSVVGSRP